MDGNGFLASDEFLVPMKMFDRSFAEYLSRLSHRETTLFLASAIPGSNDIDGDGVVQLDEFVCYAVDLIVALKARNSARLLTLERERLVNNMIRKMMKAEKLAELSATCLASLRSLDGSGGGLLKVAEFNEALRGLTEEERQVLRANVPRDAFGRILYETFPQVLEATRTMARKRAHLEYRGSWAERTLLEECKACERAKYVPKTLKQMQRIQELSRTGNSKDFDYTGFISPPDLAESLTRSEVLGSEINRLTILQTAVLISDAIPSTDKEHAGMIDYYELVPMLINAEKLLSDPFSLKQKAEMLKVIPLWLVNAFLLSDIHHHHS